MNNNFSGAEIMKKIQNIKAVYHPRNPMESPLWRIINCNYDDFLKNYEESFEKKYGFYRKIISDVVHEYKKCGDLKKGFARIKCPGCSHEYLLSFSCKGRWFCPSCHSKKVIQFGEKIKNEILCPVPHRQYVFSIPKIIRHYFRYDKELLNKFCLCAKDSLTQWFRTILGLKEGIPGIVMVIQTFGDYCKWNPHIHTLVADGLFTKSGMFHVMPDLDLKYLEEIFRARVLKMLIDEKVLNEKLYKNIMKWRYTSGFSIHNRVRIEKNDDRGKESVAQYIIRNPFSQNKIYYNEETNKVNYHSKMTHGKSRQNFEIFTGTEFIAAITQHIPEKSFQLVRYYGWYSNRTRGERKKYGLPLRENKKSILNTAIEIIDVSSHNPKKIPSKTWRECIKKVYDKDPLECPKCGAEMKIIAFIKEPEPIESILKHLKLWKPDPKPPPDDFEDITYEPFFEAA